MHPIPYYDDIHAANERKRQAYARELDARYEERLAYAERLARQAKTRPGQAAGKWSDHVREVRRSLSNALGGFAKTDSPKPEWITGIRPRAGATQRVRGIRRTTGETGVGSVWYRTEGTREPIEFLVLNPGQSITLVCVPDIDARSGLGRSKEDVAGDYGVALARRGFRVVIPDLPGIRRFSPARNKALLLEGRCLFGEIVDDLALTLDAVDALPAGSTPIGAFGAGAGGLAVLLASVLDGRIQAAAVLDALAGTPLATRPAVFGGDAVPGVDAWFIPGLLPHTDGAELAAAVAPRPLALLTSTGQTKSRKDEHARAMQMALAGYAAAGAAESLTAWSTSAPNPRNVGRIANWYRQQFQDGAPTRGRRLSRNASAPKIFDNRTIRSRKDWEGTRGRIRRDYVRALGGIPKNRPMNLTVVGCDEKTAYTREEIHVETEPNNITDCLILKPKSVEGKLPLVLVLPGSTGWSDYTEDRYAHEIPGLGYMVAIIDAKESQHGVASNIPEGHAIVGRSVTDQQGVLDYLCTRPDVDTSRIACMGLSQGGTHTWMLAAMDERVKVAIPICGVCTYQSLLDGVRDETVDSSWMSFLDSHGIYYYIPGILQVGEQQDLVSLIAPRPLLILGGTTDNCFPEQGVRDVYRDVRRIYKLLGAQKNVACYLYEGPHGNPPELRERAYAFLRKHL